MRKSNKSLDKKDKIILDYLMKECRIPTKKLAQLTNLSHPTVIYRIQQLETQGYISSYDLFPDITRFQHLYASIYFVTLSDNTYKEFIHSLKGYAEVISLGYCIGRYDLILLVLEQEDMRIKELLVKEKQEFLHMPLRKMMPFSYSLYDTKVPKKSQESLNSGEESIRLTRTDMEVLSYLAQGGGRDPLLEIARQINRSYEKVLYSFKKLKKKNAFLLQIAQPSPDMFNLHIEFVILKSALPFQKLSRILSGIENIPYLATDGLDGYFFIFMSTGIDDYKTTVEKLYDRIKDREEMKIIHGKGWEFANRFQLKKLYGMNP